MMTTISFGTAGYYADVATKSANSAKDKTSLTNSNPVEIVSSGNLYQDILTLSEMAARGVYAQTALYNVDDVIDNDPVLRAATENRPALRELMKHDRSVLDAFRTNNTNPPLYSKISPEHEAIYKNANDEAFNVYLQEQRELGNKVIEHDFLSLTSLKSHTGSTNVDQYGYTITAAKGVYTGRGYAVETGGGAGFTEPFGCIYIDKPLKSSAVFGRDDVDSAVSPSRDLIFQSNDSVNLPGLNLEQRKAFLETAQSVLDSSGYRDAYGDPLEVLKQSFVINEKMEIYFDQLQSGLSDEKHSQIAALLSSNKTLSTLAGVALANRSKQPNTDSYSISLTDQNGNAFSNDTMKLEANGKSAVITLQEYEKMSRTDVFSYIEKIGQ